MTRWRYALAGLLAVIAAGCGGSGESGEEIVERVVDAVSEPGMIYHAIGDDNSEVWMAVDIE